MQTCHTIWPAASLGQQTALETLQRIRGTLWKNESSTDGIKMSLTQRAPRLSNNAVADGACEKTPGTAFPGLT